MKCLRYKLTILHHFNARFMHALRTLRAIKLCRGCVANVENCECVPNKGRSRGKESAKTVRRDANKLRRPCEEVRRKVSQSVKMAKIGIQNRHF